MDEMTSLMLQQIKEIDERDEHQVLAELAGETIEQYVYEFWQYNRRKKRKERTVKLSWIGVRETARAKGNILLEEPVITDLPDAIRIVVRATDLKRNFTVFGGCHQPRQLKVYDYDEQTGEITAERYEPDPYCFQKGLSKAQRNALTLCIPSEFTTKFIDRFLVAAGMTPMLKGVKRPRELPQAKGPPKSALKPKAEWDKVEQNQVPDYPRLEHIYWNLTKRQPGDMYRELGVKSRNDLTITAWEAFLRLKEAFAPAPAADQPEAEPPETAGGELEEELFGGPGLNAPEHPKLLDRFYRLCRDKRNWSEATSRKTYMGAYGKEPEDSTEAELREAIAKLEKA